MYLRYYQHYNKCNFTLKRNNNYTIAIIKTNEDENIQSTFK